VFTGVPEFPDPSEFRPRGFPVIGTNPGCAGQATG
jgi:hypothetical protein